MQKIKRTPAIIQWYAGYCKDCSVFWDNTDNATPRIMKEHTKQTGHSVVVERGTWYCYEMEDSKD